MSCVPAMIAAVCAACAAMYAFIGAVGRLDLPPGASFAGVPHTAGTREYLACEAGQLALVTGAEEFDLSPGDVVVLQGDQRHSYRNPGRVPAVGYSVVLLAGPAL
jgi:mannose-6-phosphate isomerase-like protein (cupin superfamily)